MPFKGIFFKKVLTDEIFVYCEMSTTYGDKKIVPVLFDLKTGIARYYGDLEKFQKDQDLIPYEFNGFKNYLTFEPTIENEYRAGYIVDHKGTMYLVCFFGSRYWLINGTLAIETPKTDEVKVLKPNSIIFKPKV